MTSALPSEETMKKVLGRELNDFEKNRLKMLQEAYELMKNDDPMLMNLSLVFANLIGNEATEDAIEKKSEIFIERHRLLLMQQADSTMKGMFGKVAEQMLYSREAGKTYIRYAVAGFFIGSLFNMLIFFVLRHWL